MSSRHSLAINGKKDREWHLYLHQVKMELVLEVESHQSSPGTGDWHGFVLPRGLVAYLLETDTREVLAKLIAEYREIDEECGAPPKGILLLEKPEGRKGLYR